jgi:lipoprotein-anchoring transpeptidase ErfK/SrfK
MQRIVLTALAIGVGSVAAQARPLALDAALYSPDDSRAPLRSRDLPAEASSQATRETPAPAEQYPAAVPVQYVQARPQHAPPHRSNLGGGFIEFLFGGSEQPQSVAAPPTAPDARAPTPHAPSPYEYQGAPGPIERIYAPSSRTASLPPAHRPMPAIDPKYLPAIVNYGGKEKPGTVIIDTEERFLYLVMEGGLAKRYGIGVGRPGFTWAGVHKVTAKKEWPGWTPPAEMLKRQPYLPRHMPGGPDNPLGARALYLGSTLYRIHGSNEPWTIGRAVSSGCIRMRNQDVMDLYDRVGVGAKVVVI